MGMCVSGCYLTSAGFANMAQPLRVPILERPSHPPAGFLMLQFGNHAALHYVWQGKLLFGKAAMAH